MRLKHGEEVLLTKDLFLRSSYSAATIPAGTTVRVQQVNELSRKYLVENVWIDSHDLHFAIKNTDQ